MTRATHLHLSTSPEAETGHDDKQSESVTPAATPVPPTAAPPPAAPVGAGYIGVLCALGLMALGVVGIRDGIAAAGWIRGSRWTQNAVNWIDGQSFHVWMIPVGVAALLLGLVCVYVAVKPRRVRAIPLTARTSIYLDLADTSRVAAAAARAVPGVVDVRSRARRRTITIRAQTTGGDPASQRAAIIDAVTDALSSLAKTPTVRVRTNIGGEGS